MRLGTWNTADPTASKGYLADLHLDIAVLPEWGQVPMQFPESANTSVEFGVVGKRARRRRMG
jgi:hypothetical protein